MLYLRKVLVFSGIRIQQGQISSRGTKFNSEVQVPLNIVVFIVVVF